MKVSTVAAFTALAVSKTVTATHGGKHGGGGGNSYNWYQAPFRQIVPYTDSDCSDTQNKGWDFSDLKEGDFSDYQGFKWSGWSCGTQASSSRIKRTLKRRGGGDDITYSAGSKHISCSIKPDDYSNEISYDKHFNVDSFYVSAERDVTVEFNYEMPDGSECRKVSRCAAGGARVDNNQCGGASKCRFRVHHSDDKKTECKFNIHKVNFKCGTAKQKPPKYNSPDYQPAPSYASQATPTYGYYTPSPEATPTESAASYSPPVSYNAPDVLPQCVKSWMYIAPKCSDSYDTDCYCPNQDYTNKVYDCVQAYAASDSDAAYAIQSFQGMCNSHISKNPGLVTNYGSYLPMPKPEGECTTVTVSQTIQYTPYGIAPTQSTGYNAPTETCVTGNYVVPYIKYTQTASYGAGLVPATYSAPAVYTPPPMTYQPPPPSYATPAPVYQVPPPREDVATPTPSAPAYGTPAPSAPVNDAATPAPSAPVEETPAPAPAPSPAADSEPAPSAPAESAPADTPAPAYNPTPTPSAPPVPPTYNTPAPGAPQEISNGTIPSAMPTFVAGGNVILPLKNIIAAVVVGVVGLLMI